MTRTRLRFALLALAALPLSLTAQTTPTAVAAPTPAAEAGAGKPAAQPKRERIISKDLSSALSSGIRYQPPPPPKPEAEDVDLRDVDKPRNEIIRLPKYVVQAQRPPVFNDRNLYSKEMLRRLAYQRYISSFGRNVLNGYRLPIIGGGIDAYALIMYEAEQRKENMAEIDDKVAMYQVSGDNTSANQLKDDAQRTFMRRTDYSVTPGTSK